MAIRSWGGSWRIQVLFSLLVEVVYEESHDGFFGAQLERYSVFLDYVYQHKLQDVQKPILNGDDVRDLFEFPKWAAKIVHNT